METLNAEPLVIVRPAKGCRVTKWLGKCSDCKAVLEHNNKMTSIKAAQDHIYGDHAGRGSVIAGQRK